MPDVGINHIGFTVKSVKDIEQRLSSLNPPVKLVASPQDGRYEEWRITDPDGTIFEIAEGGWEAGGPKRLPAIRYVGIRSEDPERLAIFYKSALPISEVNRVTDPTGEARAIFLSAGKTALGLLKKTSANKNGFERVGFQVGSIDEIKKRLRNAPTYLYPGEPEVSVMTAPSGDPGKSLYLKDPDGNIVELSEEGWIA
jgi:catechol 2,3-dioxygenase-like lactoylglutathione lyase family enzyme